MRSWRSEENFMSANLNEDTLREGLELVKTLYHSTTVLPPGLTFETRSNGEVIACILHTLDGQQR